MVMLRRVLLGLLFVAVLIGGWRFAAQNSSQVAVSYLAGETPSVALWLALLIAFGLGVVVAGLFAGTSLARTALLARRYRKTVAGLEAEVHQLRNLPLIDEDPELAGESLGVSGGSSGRSV
jgi:uncharacterized membrane protein YciS (DUF1049 family)